MRIVAIIQARMGSTRLPQKVLAEIAGESMLARVCRRVGRSRTVDQVVVATTVAPRDRAIVRLCEQLAVTCFRGSESDVLDRYHQAAIAHRADVIVRITADCPLIDPKVVDRVVDAFLRPMSRGHRPDYASNTLRRTWPRGLDTEVMTAEALARACREADRPYERVHVTPYIYRHPELFESLPVCRPIGEFGDLGALRWTVDEPADLELVRVIYSRLGAKESFSWNDVRRLLRREPELARINRDVRQKHISEG